MSLPETNTIIEIPQLTRQISSNVSDQRDQPTCWIFAASRVILKFIKSFLQDLQTLPTDNSLSLCGFHKIQARSRVRIFYTKHEQQRC